MEAIKSVLRGTGLYRLLRRVYRAVHKVPRHPLQKTPTKAGIPFKRLGSGACGWVFMDDPALYNSTIISAGLGEDASFDLEFAKRYNAKIIIVDPTPRATVHFGAIINHLGQKKTAEYSSTGTQPIAAYDLEGVRSDQLVLVEKALWNEPTTLKFFAPQNPDHVSHSAVNFQNNYSDDTPYLEVDAIPFGQLMADQGIVEVPLIKLDIEGAEVEVLIQCLDEGIKPNQILVEFDELNMPSDVAFERVDRVHARLVAEGYDIVRTDGQADFLYVHSTNHPGTP
ncbi:MAG: FkbM family methyltransferase [Pseudomonadota bacterium]